ncbi:ABC transporter substrate-binding protein [Paenibacillus ginsengarvi]|uniref:Extracellular solute-binding protein n=1 Tax=Paenibacillus ginsengarvi TaxID=400777 RepID=A0A3B0CKF4_9BACL|nr:extracellular solute-binding protein [Paenibacillus ginsengarvi]RKN84476.1 extracellular solute-binding protein [Paenibacillus ginsengarvi]
MTFKWGKAAVCFLTSAALVSGCGGGEGKTSSQGESAPKGAEPAKPVTLTLYNAQPGAVDFEKLGIAEAVKQKFPHITLQLLKREKGMEYADWVTGKTPVDIIYESTAFTVSSIKTNGLHVDLQEQIKLNGFKTDVFEPNVLAHAMSTNSEGKLYGLPFTMNRYALFYNKGLFDRFGAAYPKDGLTWDQVYDLAKKLTRTDAGAKYYGFTALPNNIMLNNQLSLGPLDLKEDKAAMNTDGWKLLLDNLRRFGEIPNNAFVPVTDSVKGTVAMILDSGSISQAGSDIEWDLASVPELPQKPKTGFKPASLSLFLASTSAHKEEAFKVMAFLVSSEMQTKLTRQAIGTPLADPGVRKSFGQDLPQWKGKNVQALYYYPDAPALPPRADQLTNVSVNFSKLFTSTNDSNTILRDFDDEINKAIQTEKAKLQAK